MREKHVVEQDRKTNKRTTNEKEGEGENQKGRKREREKKGKRKEEKEGERSEKKVRVEEAVLEKCGEEKPGEGRDSVVDGGGGRGE